MRNSARSSTAVPAWTTVQREKRSSGTAALAVDRYWAEPSASSRGSHHFPVGMPAVTGAATKATGIWWLPTCSNQQSSTAGFARCGASRVPASPSIKAAVSDRATAWLLVERSGHDFAVAASGVIHQSAVGDRRGRVEAPTVVGADDRFGPTAGFCTAAASPKIRHSDGAGARL